MCKNINRNMLLVVLLTVVFASASVVPARAETVPEYLNQPSHYVYMLETDKIIDTSTNQEAYNDVVYLYPGDTFTYESYTKIDTSYKHNNGYCWGDCEDYGKDRRVQTIYRGLLFQKAGSIDVSVGSNVTQETFSAEFVTDGVLGTKDYTTGKTIEPKSGYVLKVWADSGYETRESSGLQCKFGKALDEYNVWSGKKMYVQTYILNSIFGLPATITEGIDAAPFTVSGTIASGDQGNLSFESTDTNVFSVEAVDDLSAKITVHDYGTAYLKVTSSSPQDYKGYSVYIPVSIASHTHTYSSLWSYDESNHWYAANCEHTSEVTDNAAHTFGDGSSCSVCGYKTGGNTPEKNNGDNNHNTGDTSSSKAEEKNNNWYRFLLIPAGIGAVGAAIFFGLKHKK